MEVYSFHLIAIPHKFLPFTFISTRHSFTHICDIHILQYIPHDMMSGMSKDFNAAIVQACDNIFVVANDGDDDEKKTLGIFFQFTNASEFLYAIPMNRIEWKKYLQLIPILKCIASSI